MTVFPKAVVSRAEEAPASAEWFRPGTRFIYWTVPDLSRTRAVYNLPEARWKEIEARIIANPAADYRDLVGDVPGAAYGDEWAVIEWIPAEVAAI